MSINNKKKRFFFDLAQDDDPEQSLLEEDLFSIKEKVTPQNKNKFNQKQNLSKREETSFDKDSSSFDFGPLSAFEKTFPKSFWSKNNSFQQPEQINQQNENNLENWNEEKSFSSNFSGKPKKERYFQEEQNFQYHNNGFLQQKNQNFQQQFTQPQSIPPQPKTKIPGIVPVERQEKLDTGVHFYTSQRVWQKVRNYSKAVNIPISRILTIILDNVIEE